MKKEDIERISIEALMAIATGTKAYDITNNYISIGDGGIECGNKSDDLVDALFKKAFGKKYLDLQDEFLKEQHKCMSDYASKINALLIEGAEKIKGKKIKQEIIHNNYKGEFVRKEKI